MIFTILLKQLFSWLPGSLSLIVFAVFAVSFFCIVVKLLGIILDWIFKFIDIFT